MFQSFVNDLLFVGADADASLTITTEDATGFMFWGGPLTAWDCKFTVQELNITMDSNDMWTFFRTYECSCVVRFVDANIKTNSTISACGDMFIVGDTHFEFEFASAEDINITPIDLWGCGGNIGYLVFEDFVGEFKLSLSAPVVESPAIAAIGGFKFIVGGAELGLC